MYVRLAFAVAAHLESEILIVDEVLAVGDSEFQAKCLGKMKDVSNKEGRTVLFVSHNMGAVKGLCQNCVVLKNGGVAMIDKSSHAIPYYLQENLKALDVDLLHRKDRQGNKSLLFTSTWTETNQGERRETFLSGDEVVICASFKTDKYKESLLNLVVAFAVYDVASGTQITDLGNQVAGYDFTTLPEEGIFKCILPKLPLNIGNYSYNLYCKINSDVADAVEFAGKFQVQSGKFYSSAKLPDPDQGKTLFEQKWQLAAI